MQSSVNILEINENEIQAVFNKDGTLTRKHSNFMTKRQSEIYKLFEELDIKTKSDYETHKAKKAIEVYEQTHGKINVNDIQKAYTKQGKLTKRITKSNAELVKLLNQINATETNDYSKIMIKIGTLNETIANRKNKELEQNLDDLVKEVEQMNINEPVEMEDLTDLVVPKPTIKPSTKNRIQVQKPVIKPPKTHKKKPRSYNKYNKEAEDKLNEIIDDPIKIQDGVQFNLGTNYRIRFDKIRPSIIKCLDKISNQGLDGWYFKYHVRNSNWDKWTSLPLNSDNIVKIKQFLDRKQVFTINDDQLDIQLNEIGIDSRANIETSGGISLTKQNLSVQMLDKIVINKKVSQGKKQDGLQVYCDNGGAFYDGKLKESVADLEQFTKRYQIFASQLNNNNEPREEYKYNCLTYAFKQSGKFDDKTLEAIMIRCYTRLVSHKQLNELCNEFKIAVQIKKIDNRNQIDSINANNKWDGYKGNDPIAKIQLVLIGKHYFLNEYIIGLSSYYIKNLDKINQFLNEHPEETRSKYLISGYDKRRNKFVYDNNSHIKSYQLIKLLQDCGYIERLTFSERALMQSDLYQYVTEDINEIHLHENDFKLIKTKEQKKSESWPIYYADCESDVVSYNHHEAFCIACVARGSTDIKSYYGFDCLDQWLEDLPDKCIVYFHNLGYDARLMNKYTSFNEIDKTGKIITKTISYHGNNNVTKIIKLKDSYSILTMKLSAFPRAFKLACGGKEMFPYRYYTFDRLIENKGVISEAGKDEIQWDTNALKTILSTKQIDKDVNELKWDQAQFEENIDAIPNCRINDQGKPDPKGLYFDMKLYCDFYVKQDVRLLQQGFDAFRNILLDPQYKINIDADQFLTTPSIASEFCMKNIFIPAEGGMYSYAGVTRSYIQKAVEGGRCMTRDNEKWHVSSILNDFDAVSLYPSAMARLYTVSGTPVVIPKECLNTEYLLSHTALENEQTSDEKPIAAYIVHIQITKVGIHRHFPLIMKKTKKGGSTINMNVNECCEMYVDNIKLEDLIKYQGIECKILDGIMWNNSVKDFNIRDQILRLHELRCKLKKEGSAAQEVIKLIMNSLYGKTIQKEIKTDKVYKKIYTVKHYTRQYGKTGKETKKSIERFTKYADKIEFDQDGKEFIRLEKTPADNFCLKNHAKIREVYDVDTNLCCIVVNKQIDDFYAPNLIGVQILSMSKRIMNEVMCTAEDLEIPIFYQDTDSMHIIDDKIPLLQAEFKRRFGRELIGKNLGQFHSDFDPLVKNGNNPVSIESWFLGKKCYIDHLRDDAGNEGYHIRMKGVTDNCIRLEAIDKYDNDPMKVYEHLANNNSLTFDLANVKAKFQNNKDRTVSNVDNFVRTIKFIGPVNKF